MPTERSDARDRRASPEPHNLTADESVVFVAGADVEPPSAVQHLAGLAAVEVVELVVSGTAVHLVRNAAEPAPEGVVALSAPEDVWALAADQEVVALLAADLLRPRPSLDPIVRSAAVDDGVMRRERRPA